MSEKTGSRQVARPRSSRKVKPQGYPPAGALMRLRFDPPAAFTDEVFEALAAGNPDLRLERTANGDLEIMAPAGTESSNRNFWLYAPFVAWAMGEGRGLGEFCDASGGFFLPNGANRSPDVAWVRLDRWEAAKKEQTGRFFRVCPDFVVELVSETDRLAKAREKMREYVEQGARLGWLIDPIRKKVEIYRLGHPVELLDRPESLSGEDVLPGLVMKLDVIFPR